MAALAVAEEHSQPPPPDVDEDPHPPLEPEPDDSMEFKHFIAHNANQTCSADSHARPFNNQIRGVNLGGWMVLEPWITPSLFYQFLGGDENNTAFDTYTFCEVLGPEEGNKQFRRHWETWVTEEIIEQLADSGAVNSLRLPVGDFMYKPYGPYVGCTDGALDYVDKLLDWAYSNGLTVLIDIHAMKGSQNGFDNSGQTMGFKWTSALNTEPAGLVTFEHWPMRTAEWMGKFDVNIIDYTEIYHDNIEHSLQVITEIVKMYSGHPALLGLQPVNEPWQYTPIKELQKFYWDGYLIVKKHAPYWKYIMHDSFRFSADIWGGFMDGCPDRALDTHIYQAWENPASRIYFYTNACQWKHRIAEMEREFGPVIVGEWSLATDNCAMWLNGFNDNLPGFPRLPCKYIPCSDPYMGTDQPGTPVDPSKPIQGPYGTGMSGPIFGFCPVDRDWLRESSGDIETGRDWIRAPPEAPKGQDDTDDVMTRLAYKKINAFSGIGHGFYFWNFRTDVYEPHWSYMDALDRGWIPKGNLNDQKIVNACRKEDNGEFKCVAKHGQLEKSVRGGVKYCLEQEEKDQSYVDNLSGKELIEEATKVFGEFWETHRTMGATCDFGGVAALVELNRTIPDDDAFLIGDDDEYFGNIYGTDANLLLILGTVLVAAVVGGSVGFVVAMNVNKTFNRKVRESRMFSRISTVPAVRKSLAFDKFDYDQLGDVPENEPLK